MIIAGGRQLLADTLQLCLLPFFAPLLLRFFSLVDSGKRKEEMKARGGEDREKRKEPVAGKFGSFDCLVIAR